MINYLIVFANLLGAWSIWNFWTGMEFFAIIPLLLSLVYFLYQRDIEDGAFIEDDETEEK
jgi:hypothetical protein